jgi:Reductive dehalogenase subunit
MGIRWGRWLLGRWLRGGTKDPLWDHFIYRAPADPKNNLTPALRGAPEGRIYPVKAEVSDPHTMSHHIKELARWFGADLVGIAALQPAHLLPGGQSDATGSGTEETERPEHSARQYPFAVICAIATDYDPQKAQGLGGQLAVQNGVVVNHHLRNYIRELGYRASIGGADPLAVAAAAGLGELDSSGRFVTKRRGAHIHVADAILTDLPLAPDTPQQEGR